MPPIRHIIRYVLLFIGSFVLTTAINTIAWNAFIDGVVYYKVPFFDTEGLDYLIDIGNWIHEDARFTDVINYDRQSFKDTQQVLTGWTNGILWMLWIAMFFVSLLISVFLSWWTGHQKRIREEQAGSSTGG